MSIADQVLNSVLKPSYKYFSLHDNKLDGSYHPAPDTTDVLVPVDLNGPGKNLFNHSATLQHYGTSTDQGNPLATFTEDAEGDYMTFVNTKGGNRYWYPVMNAVKEQGVTYVLSIEIRSQIEWRGYWYPSEKYTGIIFPSTKGKWERLTFTYTQTGITNSDTANSLFGFHSAPAGSSIDFRRIKLEKGNKVTPWRPAPVDGYPWYKVATNSEVRGTIADVNLVKVDLYENRNLLINTSYSQQPPTWNNSVATIMNGNPKSVKVDKVGLNYGVITDHLTDIVTGETYVLTGEIKSEDLSVLNYNYVMQSGGNYGLPPVNIIADNQWHKYDFPFIANTRTKAGVMIGANDNGTSFELRKLKLEKGTEVTPWQPAPEDNIPWYIKTKTINLEPIDLTSIGQYKESKLAWNQVTPTGTTVKVEVSLDNLAWRIIQSGDALTLADGTWLTGKKLYIRQTLTTTDQLVTPSITNFTYEVLGKYYPEVGWWGNALSDANGKFSSESIEIFFDKSIDVPAIQLKGDDKLDVFPVDFVVTLRQQDVTVKRIDVKNNTNNHWVMALEDGYATSIIFYIYKINKPHTAIKILEAGLTNVIKLKDTLNISSTVRSSSQGVSHKYSSDSLIISANTGIETEVAIPVRKEVSKVSLHEQNNMRNINTVMIDSTRQVFGRVEILYTDPLVDDSVEVTASEIGYGTDPMKLADGIGQPKYKTFSLHENALDKSYHPRPSLTDREDSPGLWGTQLSDAEGNFYETVGVTITFGSRALQRLVVQGDDKLDVYPVDFEIAAFDAEHNLLLSREVYGNTIVDWQEPIETILGVATITLEVYKINKPFHVLKLSEFYNVLREEYTGEEIESISLLEETGYSTGSVPMGNISSNEIDISLSNIDGRFKLSNKQSALYGYVKRNRKVMAWLGAEIMEGTIEWYPLGTFWTTQWDIPNDTVSAHLVARDRLELLRLTDFETSKVYENHSLYQLFKIVLTDAGLFSHEYEIDTALSGLVIPYAWFGLVSHRKALEELAECGIIQVYCTKLGVVRVTLNEAVTETSRLTFDDDTNVYSTEYPLAVAEQTNYVEVTANRWMPSLNEELYKSEEVITIAAGGRESRRLQFSKKPTVAITEILPVAGSGIVVESYEAYAWGVDIVFYNSAAVYRSITSLIIKGNILVETGKQSAIAKDDSLILEDGKIRVEIAHDFIQEIGYAQQLANTVLNTFKSSRYDATIDNRGNIALNLGDRVTILESYDGSKSEYVTTRQKIDWDGALEAVTEVKKL